jgi:hypothetical protein
MDADEKDAMRRLVIERDSWSHSEQRDVLGYCPSDVTSTEALLLKMAPSIDWPRAVLRGRYMAAVARMYRAGVPIDLDLLVRLRAHWDKIQHEMIWRTDDVRYNIYDGRTFKQRRFERWLALQGIPWPRTASGLLATDVDTFTEQVKHHPELEQLMGVRGVLGAIG